MEHFGQILLYSSIILLIIMLLATLYYLVKLFKAIVPVAKDASGIVAKLDTLQKTIEQIQKEFH